MISRNDKAHDSKRQRYNRKIIRLISAMVENHPYLRMGQILTILGLANNGVDTFHYEPWELYEEATRYVNASHEMEKRFRWKRRSR